MPKENKQNKKETQNTAEKKTGYGNKKLVGENRPAE